MIADPSIDPVAIWARKEKDIFVQTQVDIMFPFIVVYGKLKFFGSSNGQVSNGNYVKSPGS